MRLSLAVRIVLVVVSAAMAAAVFPPVAIPLLAPLAWIPLFFALEGQSARIGFRLGSLHGILLYAATLNWLSAIFGAPAFVLLLVVAFFTGVFGSCAAVLSKLPLPRIVTALGTATLWTGCEYYRSEWFILRFPWITPGTGLPPNFLTPWIGVYGVSFLVALAAALLAIPGRKWKLSGAALSAALLGLVLVRPGPVQPAQPLRIGLVQTENGDLDSALTLSAKLPAPLDAIVWPEYALQEDLRRRPEGLASTRAMMAEKGAQLLVLANPAPDALEKFENTALAIGRTEIFGAHIKNRPVHFMQDGTPGTDAPAIATPLGKVAAPVCFDNDYEQIVRRAVNNGAEFFLVPSMDGVAWTKREHQQHAVFVQHRAAETGRWFAVASSSGQTQIVDPHGNVTANDVPLMEDGILTGEIGRETRQTFFIRVGWLLGPICTVLTAIFIAALLISGFREMRAARRARRAGLTAAPAAE